MRTAFSLFVLLLSCACVESFSKIGPNSMKFLQTNTTYTTRAKFSFIGHQKYILCIHNGIVYSSMNDSESNLSLTNLRVSIAWVLKATIGLRARGSVKRRRGQPPPSNVLRQRHASGTLAPQPPHTLLVGTSLLGPEAPIVTELTSCRAVHCKCSTKPHSTKRLSISQAIIALALSVVSWMKLYNYFQRLQEHFCVVVFNCNALWD